MGDTLFEPLASTLPTPSSVTSSEFSVLQVSVDDWPRSIEAGLADSVAVTGLGGGGGGGGACAFGFDPQPLINKPSNSAARIDVHFFVL